MRSGGEQRDAVSEDEGDTDLRAPALPARPDWECSVNKLPISSGSPNDDAAQPPGHTLVASGLGLTAAEEIGRRLTTAGLPFLLRPRRHYGLTLYVATEHAPTALALLEEKDLIPAQPGMGQEPVIQVGGPCPACGAQVPPSSTECPGCGLRFG